MPVLVLVKFLDVVSVPVLVSLKRCHDGHSGSAKPPVASTLTFFAVQLRQLAVDQHAGSHGQVTHARADVLVLITARCRTRGASRSRVGAHVLKVVSFLIVFVVFIDFVFFGHVGNGLQRELRSEP